MQDLISINVWLAGRSYRIRINPAEEAAVRRSVKRADEKIGELRQHYAGKDDQDFVAMCLLMYASDSASNPGEGVIKEELSDLSARIQNALKAD